MNEIIEKLVDGGVIIKDGNRWVLNDGNYHLEVYHDEISYDVIDIYAVSGGYESYAVNDSGDTLTIPLTDSNMLLTKKIDIMSL